MLEQGHALLQSSIGKLDAVAPVEMIYALVTNLKTCLLETKVPNAGRMERTLFQLR